MLVAIKNKNGMVLTADKNGTVISDKGEEIKHNAYTKIFPLTPKKNVVVMVAGLDKVMKVVSIDELVTAYAKRNSNTFGTLDEYIVDFMQYIKTDPDKLFTQKGLKEIRRCYLKFIVDELKEDYYNEIIQYQILKDLLEIPIDSKEDVREKFDMIQEFFRIRGHEREIVKQLNKIFTREMMGMLTIKNLLPTIIIGGYGDNQDKIELKRLILGCQTKNYFRYEKDNLIDSNFVGIQTFALDGYVKELLSMRTSATLEEWEKNYNKEESNPIIKLKTYIKRAENRDVETALAKYLDDVSIKDMELISRELIKFTNQCLRIENKQEYVGEEADSILIELV